MASRCFCIFCQNYWDTPRVKFFHIPKDPERRKAWSEICGIELTDCFKVCEQHFPKSNIVYSQTYKRHRLIRDAMPVKDFVNVVPENGFPEREFAEFQSKQRKDVKDAETQTRSNNQMISCGELTVTKDYRIFTINCSYCKATFTLWNYASYMQHIKAKHRYTHDEELISYENIQDDSSIDYVAVEEVPAEEYIVGDDIVVDYEEEFIEYDPSGDEINENVNAPTPTVNNENNEEITRFKAILAKNNVIVKQFGENDNEVAMGEEVIIEDSDVQQTDLIEEINVNTTEELIVWAFIELLKTHPILWHPPPLKLPENYLLTLLGFCKTFNEEYQLGITNTGMRNSIENLQKWYQELYVDNAWERLPYPQNEYFHKCSTFLSDKADGRKTCEICQHEAVDYLQYVLHKQNAHDISMRESCLPPEQVETYLRTRWYRVLNLECQLCGHKYKYINGYVVHMKAHADVREFVCDLCGAAFVRLEGLSVHRRRHTGPIQRICKICNKGFNDFQLLGMHRRRYHRPIEGTIEEIEENLRTRRRPMRRTVQSTKYTTRIDPKTNKRFYICHFCGKEYNQYSGLHKHFRLWHKNEWVPSGRVARRKSIASSIQKLDMPEEYITNNTEEEIEVEHIDAEENEGHVEFEFDMEPAEEIEIQ